MLLALFLLAGLSGAKAAPRPPAIGIATGNVISAYSVGGRCAATWRLPFPIRDFAVLYRSGNALAVVIPKNGNPPQLCPEGESCVPLASVRRYWFPKWCRAQEFSGPSFSPNGKTVVLAVHCGGVGPIVTVDLRTHKRTVLASTLELAEQGPFVAEGPHWSPDGGRILLSYETGAAIADPHDRKPMVDLSDPMEAVSKPKDSWAHAVGWDGANAIYFVASPNTADPQFGARLYSLELATKMATPVVAVQGVPGRLFNNATDVEIGQSTALVGTASGCKAYDLHSGRAIPIKGRSVRHFCSRVHVVQSVSCHASAAGLCRDPKNGAVPGAGPAAK